MLLGVRIWPREVRSPEQWATPRKNVTLFPLDPFGRALIPHGATSRGTRLRLRPLPTTVQTSASSLPHRAARMSTSATSSAAVVAPLPELPRRAPYRTALGSGILLVIALFFAYGLPWINDQIPGSATVAAGTRIPLGLGVSYTTVEGWSLALAKTKPNDTSTLTREGSEFVFTTAPWEASRDDLVARTKTLFEGAARLRAYSDDTPFRTAAGLGGVTYTIHSATLEGRVWVIVLPDRKTGIVARVRGIPGTLAPALRDATAMVNSLTVQAIQP